MKALFIVLAATLVSTSGNACGSFQTWFTSYAQYNQKVGDAIQANNLQTVKMTLNENSHLLKQLPKIKGLTVAQANARDTLLTQLKLERLALSLQISSIEDKKLDIDSSKTIASLSLQAGTSRAQALTLLTATK